MNTVEKLSKKKNKLVIGLMSGTSADGIDAVLTRIQGSGVHTNVQPIAFETYPYPPGFKKFLLKNSNAQTARLDDVTRLHFLIGELFADAVRAICKKTKVQLKSVDLIGSHGQTIQHLPQMKAMFGKDIRSTLQIGEPAVIAKQTGIVTVGDFRTADIAVGGSGAPLVPYIDYVLFRSKIKNRALLNIGGIANITFLPAKCFVDDVFAFDTGPGNMIIDALMERFYKKSFDENGDIAIRGKILSGLLHRLMRHRYLKIQPPKSTGREIFGEKYIGEILKRAKGEKKEDIIATVTEFTALSIYDSYVRFMKKNIIDELIVSGGGVHNNYLLEALKQYFAGVKVKPIDDFGISSDAKEAIAFAILANETIAGNPANMLQATGAKKRTVLGKICLG